MTGNRVRPPHLPPWSFLGWWCARPVNPASLAALAAALLTGYRLEQDLADLPPKLRQRLRDRAGEAWGALRLMVPETSTPELAAEAQSWALAALEAVRQDIATAACLRPEASHRLWIGAAVVPNRPSAARLCENVVVPAERRARRRRPRLQLPDGSA